MMMMSNGHPERTDLGKVIGKNIRRLRDEAKLSQRAFAEIIQADGLAAWSQARLSNAETANQPLNAVFELEHMRRIFSRLLNRDVDLDEFLVDVED